MIVKGYPRRVAGHWEYSITSQNRARQNPPRKLFLRKKKMYQITEV